MGCGFIAVSFLSSNINNLENICFFRKWERSRYNLNRKSSCNKCRSADDGWSVGEGVSSNSESRGGGIVGEGIQGIQGCSQGVDGGGNSICSVYCWLASREGWVA